MFRFALAVLRGCAAAQTAKPPLTLDEFFNAVEIRNVRVSPDGHAVAIETARADWDADRFRNDLWLYRDDGRRVAGETHVVGTRPRSGVVAGWKLDRVSVRAAGRAKPIRSGRSR
jgi:hypothetical protein